MRPERFAFCLVLGCLVTLSRSAGAFGGTARELERQGNFAITNNAFFSLDHQLGNGNGTRFSIQPALDYFVVDNLSLGGAVGISFVSGGPGIDDVTSLYLAPDIGYELALSDTWSLWPSAAVQITIPSKGNATVAILGIVPFLVHPAEHFFFGIGPGILQIVTSSPTTHIVGQFLIGGYFDH